MSEQAEIEAVARAILKARFYDCEPGMYVCLDVFYDEMDCSHIESAHSEAAAVFAALAERGLAVVPAEATLEMSGIGAAEMDDARLGAEFRARRLYAAMVRAGRVGGSR
jgi:hypothetical protein